MGGRQIAETHPDRQASQQTDKPTSNWKNGHRDRQVRPLRCLPSPLLLMPSPGADTTKPGAQIYLRMLPQSAIGFVITDSNVHRINILTN